MSTQSSINLKKHGLVESFQNQCGTISRKLVLAPITTSNHSTSTSTKFCNKRILIFELIFAHPKQKTLEHNELLLKEAFLSKSISFIEYFMKIAIVVDLEYIVNDLTELIDLSIMPSDTSTIDMLELENLLGFSSPTPQISSPIFLDSLPTQMDDLNDSVEFDYILAIGNRAVLVELRSNAQQENDIVESAITSRVAAINEDEIRAEAARLWRADGLTRKRLLKKDRSALASIKQSIRRSENAKKDLRFLINSGTLSVNELNLVQIQLSEQ